MDHGWSKGLLFGLVPGGPMLASGRTEEGIRELAAGIAVIIPAVIIWATWSSQVNRLQQLSITDSWLLGHGLISAVSILSFEFLRVATSGHREGPGFMAPRWMSAAFLPCLFLLQITPRLIEAAPQVVEPVWYGALVLGGISAMTSAWCIIYHVRSAGPKDARLWGAAALSGGVFLVLLLVSGVINLRLLF